MKQILLKVSLAVCIFSIGMLVGTQLQKSFIASDNGSLSTTDKIAVVILDEGVKYKGEDKNFGSELISAQNGNYVITSLEDAKSGIVKGTYAAYVIIPAEFSRNVVSVNQEPSKSIIRYEISGNLTVDATNTATLNVYNLCGSLNNDVGYMYLYSILNEYQQGQSNAATVIKNDKESITAILELSGIDLIQGLDIKAITKLSNTISSLDISSDFGDINTILNSIGTKYEQYMTNANEGYKAVKTEFEVIEAIIAEINAAAQDVPIISKTTIENHNYANLIAYLQTYNSSLFLTPPIDIGAAVNAAMDDTIQLTQTLSARQKALMDKVSDFEDKSARYISYVDGFDFQSYIKSTEINALVNSLSTHSSALRTKIDNKNAEYVSFVDQVYSDAYGQLDEVVQKVNDYKKKSDEKLSQGLSNVQRILRNNSAENQELMKSYINSLEYTKNGDTVKTQAARFILESSTLSGAKAVRTVKDGNADIILYGLVIVSGLVSAVAIFLEIRKKAAAS